jgi:hypothetical protein
VPVPAAARSKAYVYGRSPTAIVGSNPTERHGVCLLCVLCCQIEVSAIGLSLVQRSPTDRGASLCVIKKPRLRGGHDPRWAAEPEIIIIKPALRKHWGFINPSEALRSSRYYLKN